MPRYRLFLLERPTGDARRIQRATWELPSALDVAKLTRALKGEIEVDWLEIAASDRRREILKIQHELSKHGCMLAIDDAGGSLTKDLTAAVRQALSREGRRASRERARQRTIWEGGEGWRAIPVAVARHARAIASALAALAVVGGSVVLLAVWMNGAPRASGGGSASALDRLSALGRGDANLPAIPESAEGGGGAAEPGEPVSRGGARPLPAPEGDGSRPAIPDVPSGGAASGGGAARARRASGGATDDTRAIEIAGFAVGIGWAVVVEAFARRGTRRSGSRSRAVLMRLAPAAVAGTLTVAALIALEARTAPAARAAAAKSAPQAKPAGPASRHESRGKPAPAAAAKSAARAAKPAATSYRALMAALAPAPDPCAEAHGAFARFLCLERLRHPSAAAAGDDVASGDEPATATPAPAGAGVAPRGGGDEGARVTPAAAAAPAAQGAPAASVQAAAASPTEPAHSAAATVASPPVAPPASGASMPGAATPAPSAAASSAPATPRTGASAPLSPTATTSATPPATPRPTVAARRNLLAALPTFLLGLLAGTLGLTIVALGTSGKREAAT